MYDHHVLVVQIFHVESSATFLTEMFVVSRVVSHVTSQIRLVSEGGATQAAWKSICVLIGRVPTNHHLPMLKKSLGKLLDDTHFITLRMNILKISELSNQIN